MEFKQQLATKAENIQKKDKGIKLTANMPIELHLMDIVPGKQILKQWQ